MGTLIFESKIAEKNPAGRNIKYTTQLLNHFLSVYYHIYPYVAGLLWYVAVKYSNLVPFIFTQFESLQNHLKIFQKFDYLQKAFQS